MINTYAVLAGLCGGGAIASAFICARSLGHTTSCRTLVMNLTVFCLLTVSTILSAIGYNNSVYSGKDNTTVTAMAKVVKRDTQYISPARGSGRTVYILNVQQGDITYDIDVPKEINDAVNIGDYVTVEYNVNNGKAVDRIVSSILPTDYVDCEVVSCTDDGLVTLRDIRGNIYSVQSDKAYAAGDTAGLCVITKGEEEIYQLGG